MGQGLAGSVLADLLIKNGQKVYIIDTGIESSSKVAAGLFNPVTGKRYVKTWLADSIFPFLNNYYQNLEKQLDSSFFYPQKMFKPFMDIEQQTFLTALTADLPDYLLVAPNPQPYHQIIEHRFGGVFTNFGGWLDVKTMIKLFRNWFKNDGVLEENNFEFKDIRFTNNIVFYQDKPYQKILFCEGSAGSKNPYFDWLPFKSVRGELLTIKLQNQQSLTDIINHGIFIIPLGNHLYKVGATYDWDNLSWQTTQAGKEQLVQKLKLILKTDFEIIAHEVGVRPSATDRRPLIGLHPDHKQLGFFNGFGSKGVSLIPYFAAHFVDFLINNKELEPSVNIKRHFSLYCH